MELDDLKADWKEKSTKQIKEKDMEQLQSILKEKTSGVLTAVKTNYEKLISFMLVSIIGTLAVSGFLPWLMGQEGPIYAWPTTVDRVLNVLVILLISITFIFFYWIKYTDVKTVVDTQELKGALSGSIKKLKRSFRQEVFFIIFLFIAWTSIGRFHSEFSGHGNFWDIFRADILLAIAALAILLGTYLFFRFRHYKRYIDELQQYLAEFD
jgi:hypothetical protein